MFYFALLVTLEALWSDDGSHHLLLKTPSTKIHKINDRFKNKVFNFTASSNEEEVLDLRSGGN